MVSTAGRVLGWPVRRIRRQGRQVILSAYPSFDVVEVARESAAAAGVRAEMVSPPRMRGDIVWSVFEVHGSRQDVRAFKRQVKKRLPHFGTSWWWGLLDGLP